MLSSKHFSSEAARSFSLCEPIGRISAFDSSAAVSTEVATPTPHQQRRRTRVQAIAGHHIEDKGSDAFITRARHQHHRFPRGAAAARHIGINAALVGIRDNLPEYRRRPFTQCFAGIVFIKSLRRCYGAAENRRSL